MIVNRVVGIDVGLKGALGQMDDGILTKLDDLPIAKIQFGKKERSGMFIEEIVSLFDPGDDPNIRVHVFIERQQCTGEFEKMTKSALANYMEGYGKLQGYISGRGWSLTLVPPVTWIPAVNARPGKDGHIIRFCQLFPKQVHLLKGRAGQAKDGRADAGLITYYGYQQLIGKR